MKLLKVGSKAILIEKKDGTKKKFPVTEAVAKYASAKIPVGSVIKAVFENNEITKLTTYQNNSNAGGGYNKGGYDKGVKRFGGYKLLERDVFKSVATIVAGTEGVNFKNVEEVTLSLYNKIFAVISVKVAKEGGQKNDVDDLDVGDDLGELQEEDLGGGIDDLDE